MITICFRFDDPSQDSDHALEKAIIDAFARQGLTLTVAVIPFHDDGSCIVPLQRSTAEHLVNGVKAGILEIAQHGYSHVCRATDALGLLSEFAGIGESEQRRLIVDGRELLSSLFQREVTGFVPPWNTFDSVTADVLLELGFKYVSAGPEATPDVDRQLPVVAATTKIAWLSEAVSEGSRYRRFSPVIVVVLHHGDFRESGAARAPADLKALERLLGSLRGLPEVEVTPISTVAKRLSQGVGLRCARHLKFTHGLHWRLQRRLPRHCLVRASLTNLLLHSVFSSPTRTVEESMVVS